jgi:hypothetical protein
MRTLWILFILGTLSGLEAQAFSSTNDPISGLAERVAVADRIIATNWAAAEIGEPGFARTIAAEWIKAVVKALSAATFYRNQEHPDWEWDWQLRLYKGTNFLAAICFRQDTFLTDDDVWRDATGLLERLYRDLENQEYVARVYKDESKEFADASKAEAKQWLRSPTHRIVGEDKRKVLKYVHEFYTAGAARVFVTDIKTHLNGKNPPWENARYLCVVLPHDSEARHKVFRVHWQAVREWCLDADDDVGQKYLWYRIDWHDPASS